MLSEQITNYQSKGDELMEESEATFTQRVIAFVVCFTFLGTVLSIGFIRSHSTSPPDTGEATVNRIRDRFRNLR